MEKGRKEVKIVVKIEDVELSYEEGLRTNFAQDTKMLNTLIEEAMQILHRKHKEREEQSDE